ncbi:MAG: ATP-binding protein [Candidatus Woesearchaeota archaeon]
MENRRLEEFNHWWIKGRVDPDLALQFKRDIYKEIEKHLRKRFIISLVGLRRIGKTTIIYQVIEHLLRENTPPVNILFFSFDDISAGLSEVLETYKEIQNKDFRSEKTYVFLDEIQKCNNWENELKKYYDLYPKIKFMISGSESLFIRKKTSETLAGRIFHFHLEPFSFKEYLRLSKIEDTKYETRIKPLFIKYVERGGFPETFDIESDKDYKQYISTLVVDKIIYKDIPKLFKIEDPQFLTVLLELIAANPGMYIDYQSLSRQFDKDRRVIKDYISFLKESFLIRVLGNYRTGNITTLRKKKRAYPSDNAIITLYKTSIDSAFFGRMVETLAINHLKATSFYKNRNEVDIIHNHLPIEIKYQETISKEDLKPLREFMRNFNQKEALLITKKDEREIRSDEGTITLIPAWKWIIKQN